MSKSMMLAVLAVLPANAMAKDFKLSKDGIGPFAFKAKVKVSKSQARLEASAINESGVIITSARFCVKARGASDCTFDLETDEGTWYPKFPLKWDVAAQPHAGIKNFEVVLTSVQPHVIHHVRKIFVEPLEGSNGPMVREQLMAILTNTTRFTAVEDSTSADARLRGRAESRVAGYATDSSTRGGGIAFGSATVSATRSGSVGSARADSRESVITNSRSKSITEDLMANEVVLRLVLPSGETLWAWDDTKTCTIQKAKCAVDDLVEAAAK
jgi:hypothetical protein